jgi:hypothetical protein
MSLERIDQYIKELTAITDYPAKCLELNDAYRFISDLQEELTEKEKIISIFKDTIEKQSSAITQLGNALKEAREELRIGANDEGPRSSKAQFRFAALGVFIDGPKFVTKRKMNAICCWLLEGGFMFV